jgi:cation diffusion facilitator CzcD-associated flavoprotein CzcO
MQWSCAQDDRRQVIIIGGGASGVLLACHLLRYPTVT